MQNEQRRKKELAARFFHELEAPGWGLDERFFPAMGSRLVDLAQVPVGAYVLDVAAGRGASLFPAAAQVGQGGRVVGIDLAPSMVRNTTAEIERLAIANAEMLKMDAENLRFADAYFDRVLCGFALFFFPRLGRALSEIRRVLKPGGRFCASTFAQHGYPWSWYEALLREYGLTSRGHDVDEFTTEDLDMPAEVENAFTQAGFVDVQVLTEAFNDIADGEDTWWDRLWSSPDRLLLETLEANRLIVFKADVFERLRELKHDDGIHGTYRALFTWGTRPGKHSG